MAVNVGKGRSLIRGESHGARGSPRRPPQRALGEIYLHLLALLRISLPRGFFMFVAAYNVFLWYRQYPPFQPKGEERRAAPSSILGGRASTSHGVVGNIARSQVLFFCPTVETSYVSLPSGEDAHSASLRSNGPISLTAPIFNLSSERAPSTLRLGVETSKSNTCVLSLAVSPGAAEMRTNILNSDLDPGSQSSYICDMAPRIADELTFESKNTNVFVEGSSQQIRKKAQITASAGKLVKISPKTLK